MKKIYAIFILSIFTIVIGMEVGKVYAVENTDPFNDNSQFAFGENVGWLNFEPNGDGGDGAEVSDLKVTGHVWAENIGWINLSPVFGGVINDRNGNLSGFAWGENVGWINFSPVFGGGVKVDVTSGNFDGWAWGENIGWIDFQNMTIPFKVQTDWNAQSPTVVELISFTADDVRRGIALRWETATEIDNAGFNIWRARAEDGQFVVITGDLIPAKGNVTRGAKYSYLDKNVLPGLTYFYKLQDVEFDGDSELHGPVSVTVDDLRIRVSK